MLSLKITSLAGLVLGILDRRDPACTAHQLPLYIHRGSLGDVLPVKDRADP